MVRVAVEGKLEGYKGRRRSASVPLSKEVFKVRRKAFLLYQCFGLLLVRTVNAVCLIGLLNVLN